MAENPVISEEFKNKIGVEWELGTHEVEKGMLQKFVRAIGDPNPLWQNEEHARQSQYGGIIAPPTFILTIGGEPFGENIVTPMFCDGLLHGSTELECHQPVRPCDKIAVTGKIANIRERAGSGMAFVTFEISYRNQRQELVAECRQTMIGFRTQGKKA